MYNTPIAYFLTFTVRGSWRHGDSRGSWQRTGRFIPADTQIFSMPNRENPHLFSEAECEAIAAALEDQCRLKEWVLHEKAVLGNHVHVVLTAPDLTPETVMKALKAKATAALRKRGWVRGDEKIWTQHGSTRYLFDDRALAAACDYVRNQ